MKKEDMDSILNNMDLPDPENIKHQQEFKIPLLSYKRSSKAGLWLLILPIIFALTLVLKYELGLFSTFLDMIVGVFKFVDKNQFLTYLIPIVLIGFPLSAMIINFFAVCHFALVREKKELIITIKYRLFNIAVILLSFAIIIFFFTPDRLP